MSGDQIMLPASFAQELLWLTDRAMPGNVAYNVPRALRLRGRLDVGALRKAFDALVARHEILRTTYATREDQAVQIVHDPRPVPFDIVDLSATPVDTRDDEAVRVVRERCTRPFDLSADLLLRATVIRYSDTDHVLLFESHHIAFDGWSRDIVFREMDAFYAAFAAGREPELPALPIQYADYAIWQREELQGERLTSLLDWWRAELGDAEHVLQLPTDFPRRGVSGVDGAFRSIRFTPELRDAIKTLGQKQGATTYMVLLAAYATVLHRYTGQKDILIGSPIAGRARPETEALIGYFANTIVQRARFDGDPTFGDLVASLRESALGAYDHQDVPFEKLALEFEGRAAATARSPLFQVVFTQLDASQAPAARMGDVTLEPFAIGSGTTKFDLTLFMSERPESLELTLRARQDLHRAESIERFLGHIQAVLAAATANPAMRVSALPLLSLSERDQLTAWNHTTADEGAPATVVELFEAQAASVPDRAAVVAGGATLTYRELNARANQLAHRLIDGGVRPQQPVGLLLDRSADAIVALLGILKSGGAYVPLSIDAPAARLAQQLGDADAKFVVTTSGAAGALPPAVAPIVLDGDASAREALSAVNPPARMTATSLAYILYTSGSTGTPKGVAVTHANVVHYTRAVGRVLGVATDANADTPPLKFGLASTLAADLGNTSLFPALLSGGTLHVLEKDVTTEPEQFSQYMQQHALDVLKITPSHLRALVSGKTCGALERILPRRWVVLGGEPFALDFARMLHEANARGVLNHYGPTETTVGVLTNKVTPESLAAAEASGAQTVPLGRPLANTRVHVVDATGAEQPVGIPGELLIGGDGVARGYLGRDDLTAERFVNFRGARVYRTGDRVRRLADGSIEFLGRADDQVKVRGYRVELGEIEQVLRSHPGVEQGVVVLRENADGEPVLAGYAVARGGYAVSHADRPTSEKLREWIGASLPAYMVPAVVMMLDALPLTPNGKVDKRALPAPDAAASAAAAPFAEPRTPTEQKLAQIWAEVLKKERVGVTESFLDLGGHSLLAIRVLGRISKTFGVRLSLRALFDAPTVAQLAELVDVETQLAALDSLPGETQPVR